MPEEEKGRKTEDMDSIDGGLSLVSCMCASDDGGFRVTALQKSWSREER